MAVNQDGRGGVYDGERDRRRAEAARRTRVPAGAIDGGRPVGELLDRLKLEADASRGGWPLIIPKPGS